MMKKEMVKKVCSYITLAFNKETGKYEQDGPRHEFEVYSTEDRLNDLDQALDNYTEEINREYGNMGLDVDELKVGELEYASEEDKLNYLMYGSDQIYELN